MRRDFGEAGACEARRYLFLAADGHVVHHVGPLRALGVGLVVRNQESPAGLERAQNLRERAVDVRPEVKRLEAKASSRSGQK